MTDVTLKSLFSGPRWTHFDVLLRDECYMRGLGCRTERETTFLREHVRYTVSGDSEAVKQMASDIEYSIEEHNKRPDND